MVENGPSLGGENEIPRLNCRICLQPSDDVGSRHQVNRQNKTIAVTADESITVGAELALIAIGYHNDAPSQDTAFPENVRNSNAITKAVLTAGVPKSDIQTEKLRVGPTEQDQKSPDIKKARQFEAQQAWHITLPVSQAQAMVDLAVQSGANEVDDVEWNVADPVALQARASGVALAKAHAIAEQMARGLWIPVRQFLDALVSIGYDGPIQAEPFNAQLRALPIDQACATTSAAMKKAFSLM